LEVNCARIGHTYCVKYDEEELIVVDAKGVEKNNFFPHPLNLEIEKFDFNKLISFSMAIFVEENKKKQEVYKNRVRNL